MAADSIKKTSLTRLEVIKAAAWGIVATLILGVLIVVGSRNLSHFDAVLVGYTFATLFAVFGITLSLFHVAAAAAHGVVLASRLAGLFQARAQARELQKLV